MLAQYAYCKRCNSYIKDRLGHKSQTLWVDHQTEMHFMCEECYVYFENRNNVDQVQTKSKSLSSHTDLSSSISESIFHATKSAMDAVAGFPRCPP